MRESIKFRIIPSKFDPINEWRAHISPFLAICVIALLRTDFEGVEFPSL